MSATRKAVFTTSAAALIATAIGAGLYTANDAPTARSAISAQAEVLTNNGDIVVREGGATTRRAIGSEGHVLTVTSGLPQWAAPAGGTVAAADITDATAPGRALLTAATVAAQRTALELGQPTTLAAQQRADTLRRRGPLATVGPSAGVGWAAPSGTASAAVPAFTRSMSGVAVVYSPSAGGHAGGYLVVASTGGVRGGYLAVSGSALSITASGGGGEAALAGVVATVGWHAVAWSISSDGATVRYSVDGAATTDAVITGGPMTFTPRLAADPVWVCAAATAGGGVLPLAYSALWTSVLSDADLALLSAAPSAGAPDLTLIAGGAPSWEWASAPSAGVDRIVIAGDTYERTGSPLVWMP